VHTPSQNDYDEQKVVVCKHHYQGCQLYAKPKRASTRMYLRS